MASCYLVIFYPCIDAGKSSCFKGQTGLYVLHDAQSDLASTTARRTVTTAFALFLYISEPLRSSSVRSVSPRQTSRVRVTMFEETPSGQRGWPKTPLPQPAGGRRVSELPRWATGSGRRVQLHGCCSSNEPTGSTSVSRVALVSHRSAHPAWRDKYRYDEVFIWPDNPYERGFYSSPLTATSGDANPVSASATK